MLSFPFFKSVRRVLALGAHSDDIEIGAGGTLATMIAANPELEMYWVVFSASDARAKEARASAAEYLATVKKPVVLVHSFRESYFPAEWAGIKDEFAAIARDFAPDLVFTHYRDDRHQDHRVLSDLAWNAFRNNFVLEYEIPKYDGDLGSPNVFVPLERETIRLKVRRLMKTFESQADKRWFSGETFTALARLRGVESAAETDFAEAFYGRKLVLGN